MSSNAKVVAAGGEQMTLTIKVNEKSEEQSELAEKLNQMMEKFTV